MLCLLHAMPYLLQFCRLIAPVFLMSNQVHTLLKGLEKIAASADIPMLVCGDFNSTPGRSVTSMIQ